MQFFLTPPAVTLCQSSPVILLLLFTLCLHSLVWPLCCLLFIFTLLTHLSFFFPTDLQLPIALFHHCCLLLLPFFSLLFSAIYMCTCSSKCGISEYAQARRGEYPRHELDAAYIHCLDSKTDHISLCTVTLFSCSEIG